MSKLRDWIVPRARIAEVAQQLIVTRLLIRLVRLKYWRGGLGRVLSEGKSPSAETHPAAPLVRRCVWSIDRAGERLHYPFKCLPRAMALQWMLARRGCSSTLVFGIANDQERGALHDLHAWVEVGGVIVIGGDTGRSYARGLVLVQP